MSTTNTVLCRLPHKAVQLHQYLRNVKNIPDLVLLLGFLAIPVTMGKLDTELTGGHW